MNDPKMELTIVATSPPVFTEATPEQRAAYEAERQTWHDGAYHARALQAEGKVAKEEADRLVREARIRRRLKRRKGAK